MACSCRDFASRPCDRRSRGGERTRPDSRQLQPAAGEFPEGVAVDKTGNVYVSLSPIGQVRKIAPDGSQSVLATLPVGAFGPLGLAVDAPGNVYAAVSTFDPATHGVYRIDRSGAAERLPGSGSILFPNGLAFDKRGNLYATDSILGAVWRIPKGGSAELWLQHPLLAGNGSFGFPFPIGANGIAYRHGEIVVTNSELGRLLRIAVEPDGSAGAPTMLAEDLALFGADGIALDVHGSLYVAVIVQSAIVRVAADGSTLTTLATAADGLDFTSSLAFGTGMRDRQAVFAVNFAVFVPGGAGPALLRVAVDEPGLPLP